jgi:predicted regulator of Ras-like GTPase activity (Roadblock/LC7/MglB family)
MKEVVEPLTQIAGVRLAALILSDGVPVVSPGRGLRAGASRGAGNGFADLEAAAGLCVGWLGEIARAVGALSWDPPERAVLRAARGSLILRRCGDVILLVVLEAGLSPEELRLPVEAAAARLQRVLRDLAAPLPKHSAAAPPAGALPNRRDIVEAPISGEAGN